MNIGDKVEISKLSRICGKYGIIERIDKCGELSVMIRHIRNKNSTWWYSKDRLIIVSGIVWR